MHLFLFIQNVLKEWTLFDDKQAADKWQFLLKFELEIQIVFHIFWLDLTRIWPFEWRIKKISADDYCHWHVLFEFSRSLHKKKWSVLSAILPSKVIHNSTCPTWRELIHFESKICWNDNSIHFNSSRQEQTNLSTWGLLLY